MASTLKKIFVILYAGEFMMGILGNGFIVLVNCIDWIRSWKFSLIDFILTCLAISRILLLCIVILFIGLDVKYEKIQYNDDNLLRSLEILWTGSNYFCTACTTCLSVFYFLKIANFSNPIFLWMKWRIHKVLLILVLGEAFSFCLCLLFKETVVRSLIKNQENTERNLTWDFTVRKYDLLTSQMLLNIMFLIPFVVSLASLLLSILSLWSHTRQMKGTGSRDSSTEAHVRAMKCMISFLLLFFIYYLTNSIIKSASAILDSFVAKIFAYVLVFFYPSFHPFLLILWNSKLKQASLSVLRKLKCCMNLRKATSP
ncbi:PREDICTED: taste receptor type 2 member 7-like [Ceratotherium simum simum]|uniref:Taste receptor type 2 n=1 Tax=Ceratotherium simum simum TaxID=73337 RepID=A0ABM0HWN7_CERSS|nr:PREDICTED: taste receptor type 2 member 7-like [Ceratotherium simum simum]